MARATGAPLRILGQWCVTSENDRLNGGVVQGQQHPIPEHSEQGEDVVRQVQGQRRHRFESQIVAGRDFTGGRLPPKPGDSRETVEVVLDKEGECASVRCGERGRDQDAAR
jgi:hypothetical protein